MTALQFLAGLAFLAAGGEALVRGASRLAMLLFVLPLVAVTIVASSPRTLRAERRAPGSNPAR